MRFIFLFFVLLISGFSSAAQESRDTLSIDSLNTAPPDTTGSDSFVYDKLDSISDNAFSASDMTARPDSTAIQSRSFDKARLEDFKNNDDFDYQQPPTVAESLWERFLSWLAQIFSWLFDAGRGTPVGKLIVYILALAGVVIIIMLLLKVDAFKVLYSGGDKSLNYDAFQENIHEMNFEKLIQQALDKKEYRLAVRLTFLNALKLLSDKQHVDWRPGKTNHDYTQELKQQELKIGFNELSFYFDYAWYGEFAVSENMYERVRQIFDTWKKKVE